MAGQSWKAQEILKVRGDFLRDMILGSAEDISGRHFDLKRRVAA